MKQTITISGYKIQEPAAYPVSLTEFERLVIGGSIASARTETNRRYHFRQFASWFRDASIRAGQLSPTVQQMIDRKKSEGFDAQAFEMWAEQFLNWRAGLLSRRASAAAEKRWESAKKPLDRRKNKRK